jgi:hypothetical protein
VSTVCLTHSLSFIAVAFDDAQQQLVTAGNKVRVWPVQTAPGNKARKDGPAHSNLVVAILWSVHFNMILTYVTSLDNPHPSYLIYGSGYNMA